MMLLWWGIIVGLASSCDTALYSCQSKSEMYQPTCECDQRDTYINLTCPIGENHTVDVLLNPLDYSFEIDCKNQFIKNMSLIPALVHERIDHADFFGFIDCSMTEFANLTSKLIQTKHINRMALKKIKYMIPDVLKGFRIKKLHFLESPLNMLPEQILYDVEGLEEIFINNNNITTLPEGLFKKSKKLHRIDLEQNNLIAIQNNLFTEVNGLTSLLLHWNKLSTISSAMFLGLNNLREVVLMSNQLVTIAEDAFIHLPQLNNLDLRNNKFNTLPAGLFKNNTKLETLKLSTNSFLSSLPDKFFANLTELKTIYIDYCNLSIIPENLFWGTTKLSTLDLKFNNLKYLKKGLFRDTINLKELNLEHNAIEILEGGIFNRIQKLKVLNLNYNKLKVMHDTFSGLNNLENLYLQHNSLSNLTKNNLKHFKNLTLLDMSYNKLSLEPQFFKGQRYSVLPLLARLEILRLQHNEVPYIFSDWVVLFSSLKELNLAYNNISFLDYRALQFVQDHTITVNLEYNKINTIDLSTAELVFTANKNNKPHANRIVLLNGNPINCDCRIYDLVRYIDGTMHADIRKVLHLKLNDIVCQTSKKYIGTPLINLKSESLICVLDDRPNLPI